MNILLSPEPTGTEQYADRAVYSDGLLRTIGRQLTEIMMSPDYPERTIEQVEQVLGRVSFELAMRNLEAASIDKELEEIYWP